MNPLFAAAQSLQRFFESRRWRFCFIGGLAVQRWGEPRLTLDVDCTLLTGFGQEGRYVGELLSAFTPIAGIILRRGDRLDADVIWRELLPLLELKGDAGTAERLRRLLDATRSM